MRTILLIGGLLIFQIFGFGQSGNEQKQKDNWELEIGYNGRITPVYLVHNYSSVGEPEDIWGLDQQDHLTGSGLNTTVRYNYSKWFAALGYSLRYDHTVLEYFDNPINKESTFGEKLLSDFHLDFGWKLYQKNDFSIAAFLGANVMNNGTQYSEVEQQVSGGDTTLHRSFSDLRFLAANAGFQVRKGNFSASLNLYQAEEVPQFYIGAGPFLIPELRLRYTLISKVF